MNALILASASAVRARLLREAGVPFDVRPAEIDEGDIKALLAGKLGADGIAGVLAERKAIKISTAHPQALVLGCDQTLAFDGRLIDKAADLAAAQALLHEMRGKEHSLFTACVLAQDGVPVWRRLEHSRLWMRPFSDAFLDDYLRTEGNKLLGSVGCYHLEGSGIQLFERVEGDYFSVLGLPLIPLLAALREHRMIGR
ncbi:MAG TPA: Maf family protein [Rhizomicrobium sp.]